MSNRLSVYLAAAFVPTLVSATWLAAVPTLWLGTDSTVILLWPTTMVPHFGPTYMFLAYLFETIFGINPGMMKALLLTQHLFLILSVTYLASAFRTSLEAVIVSTAAMAGAWFGALANTPATQALDMPFIAVVVGVLLRFHLGGWRPSLVPVFMIAAFGAALTRHASVVLTVAVPAYWFAKALFEAAFEGDRSRAFGNLRNAIVCSIGLALVAASVWPLMRLSCRYFGQDCPYSITGRAGCLRLAQLYERLPADQRETWIARKSATLSPDGAFAFRAMATAGGKCWTGPYHEIAKAFPDRQPDRSMNAALYQLLLTPDRASLEQMFSEFGAGFYLHQTKDLGHGAIRELLGITARTIAQQDEYHRPMRARLGAKDSDSIFIEKLANLAVVDYYEWFTRYLLNPIAGVSLIIVIIARRRDLAALGTSIALGATGYMLAVSAVTTVAYTYVMPVNFVLYVWTGVIACSLASSGRAWVRPAMSS